ncbi:MAG: GTPase HflX [Phycisphaerales bacterium]
MSTTAREDLRAASERAILVHVSLPGDPPDPTELDQASSEGTGAPWRDDAEPFRELLALAETAGAEVVGLVTQSRRAPRPKTYIGKGKVDELAAMVKELRAKLVLFDNDLSPNQIRELEKALSCKVIDRSELILDIFANRATTHQAKLQVEIAQLEYTAPRLRAMWSHLGQVTGGAPVGVGTRGPGETQLETDRRLVQRRISQLKRELEQVLERREREVAARRLEHFTIGIVGYTNAGKSTLFNALTAGGAYAADKPFATLGTRIEQWNLGGGNSAMLSDTVGFIRNLPHHLVASFRSTLEETIHAHLLLIVLDAADPAAELQLATVESVLEEIGATGQPRILVLNKMDRLEESRAAAWLARHPGAIAVSARTGDGLDDLRAAALEHMRGPVREVRVSVPLADARTVDFLEKRTEIVDRAYRNGAVDLTLRLGRRQLDQLLARGASIMVDGLPVAEAARTWDGPAPAKARRERPHERHERMDDSARAV